ncbi:hypothetical protein B0H14DRAFT_3046316, partial [Mycena olivaceomarginata]
CPQFRFHQADGALLSIVQLHDDFLRDLMADFVFVRHRDLHEMLLELAVQAGVRVRWGAVVKAVDCDQKLVPFMRAVTPTVHVRRPILESSVCERARVVLVGEAAHPVMPAGQHNVALGIEDAETLGALFAHVQTRAQVSRVLGAYEELRVGRLGGAQAHNADVRAGRGAGGARRAAAAHDGRFEAFARMSIWYFAQPRAHAPSNFGVLTYTHLTTVHFPAPPSSSFYLQSPYI